MRSRFLKSIEPLEQSSRDPMGDRMKRYEGLTTEDRILPNYPAVARIDGRTFSKFTRGFEKPFDEHIHRAMCLACSELVGEFKADIGYTQSDEITLIWKSLNLFDGKTHKLISALAAHASVSFVAGLRDYVGFDGALAKRPHFDARIFNVPDLSEAANAVLWRSFDATRNGISSAACCHMTPREMHKVGQDGLIEEMASRGVDYSSRYPVEHRFGSWFQRRKSIETMDLNKWESLPPEVRPASRSFERTRIQRLPIEAFVDVMNRVEVIFERAEPQT